ncbi:unnamed protein product [Lactuca saligna]|uniref:Myb/SANT-like domain-containing protein n=1 Tax=Lactuca saligna TaxID=75948 RepID=A0AA35UWC4_LACSI|nr:unnamed protein product [Lactuca saligna]
MQQLLDENLANSGLKAEPHIKSRMKTWKYHFNIVHDMVYGINTSGFDWDTDECCVINNAEVWDKPLPQFDSLCKIFGKDKATGHGATNLGENMIEETQRNSPADVEGLEEIRKETQQTTRINSKRKRPPTDDTESSYKE